MENYKSFIAWFGYGIALVLSLFLLHKEYFEKGSALSIWFYLVTVILLLLPIFLQFKGIQAILERFISGIGDIEIYRKELFKFKTEIISTLNQIKQESSNINISLIKQADNHNYLYKEIKDMLDNTNLFEKSREKIIDYYYRLLARMNLYEKELNYSEIKIEELSQIINQYEKLMSDIGIEVYRPDIGSEFDPSYQIIENDIFDPTKIIEAINTPGIRINGKIIKKAKVYLGLHKNI